ncbi:ArsA family ATPase [Promethearchaeum syntrophicum]|uniref:ArsA family ATPase n=1 Tax=Promethearchaeum syntrophicum TaxID=2594042 RepID=A0A5B9DDX3_9ARCH|nr:ArsA-related P-loop ATPase [Candidatus Prometheoarchaeum syntrophicum]QEE17448.1 Putative arsenical pump-driving ATPase [Candidatus Prometheoarchaeum syntrophicum]
MENLLVFGGKGGVGKSSISAATAVFLANQLTDKKILLISFDIAHNLSDLFDKKIGNDVTQITNNLFAIEPDPDKYAERYTGELSKKARILIKSSKIISMITDLETIITESLQSKNIPLAMKNSLFFQSIIDAENPMADIGEKQMKYKGINQNDSTPLDLRKKIPAFDILVCDFPPTGNMIALFEVPQDNAQRSMKFTLRVLSTVQNSFNKIKKLTKWAKPAAWIAKGLVNDERNDDYKLEKEEQKNLAQDILDILHDMERRSSRISSIIKGIGSLRLVSIAEKPSFEEVKRAKKMSEPFISIDGLHINRLIPEDERGRSKYLDNLYGYQEKYQNLIHHEFSELKIWESNLLDHPPLGIEGLMELANNIYNQTSIEDILNPSHRILVNPQEKIEENPYQIKKIKKDWEEA